MDLAGLLIRPSPIELFGSKGLRSYIITRVLVVEADRTLKLPLSQIPNLTTFRVGESSKLLNLVSYNRT